MNASLSDLNHVIARAIESLAKRQLPDGEFRTECRFPSHVLDNGEVVGDFGYDSSSFATSLILYNLEFVSDRDPVRQMIAKGCSALRADMDPGGLWRYWSKKNAKREIIPPDLDDTACISYILTLNGVRIPNNRWIFYDNRDSRGAFYTWLFEANSFRKKLLALYTNQRAFSCVGFQWDYADKADICPAVNANALLYLGANRKTFGTIRYLFDVVLSGKEEKELVFYGHPTSLYYMLSRAYFNGVDALGELRPVLIDRIHTYRQANGSFGNELTTAMAICSLLNLGESAATVRDAAGYLAETQQCDGSWPRITMYGSTGYRKPGTPAPVGVIDSFGSSELTTGMCLEALARYEHALAGVPLPPPFTRRTRQLQ
jgi:hypothetical protein